MWIPFLMPSSWDDWRNWLTDEFLAAVIVVAILVVVNLVFRRVIARILHRAISRAAAVRLREDRYAIERRANTLTATINWLVTIFLGFIGTAVVLDNFGLNVSALVASVGIAGVAIGLGTQSLVRDVINGTFILVEDQYSVGDMVTVAGVTGQVVDINPRRTVLRDFDGHVHSIPNSAIGVSTNMTQGFSRINLDVLVPAAIDPEAAIRMVNEVGEQFATNRRDVLSAPRVLHIESLGDEGATLKVLGDVKPGRQWDLGGQLHLEIRKRLEAALPAEEPEEPADGEAASVHRDGSGEAPGS